MFNCRGARVAFHHVSGTNVDSAFDTVLNLNLIQGENQTMIFEPSIHEQYNNGTLDKITEWHWKDLKLPIIEENMRLQFYSRFVPYKAGSNLDNIQIFTREK